MEHTAHGYWLAEAGEPDPLPAASGRIRCDVLVVGGGYTGMWTAWQLSMLEPGAHVVVLEADRCGRGPSGRNGGFVNAMWFSLPNMASRFGEGPALGVARAAQRAVDEVGEFCAEQDLDAWFRRGGYMQVSAAPAQDSTWSDAVALCGRLGEAERAVELDRDGVRERCRSPRFRGGALYPGSGTVQPARLALGLRERLAAQPNVEVLEGSPVRRMRAGAWGCLAETPEAEVGAGAGVLALGGALAAPRSPMRGRLTVASSHAVLTEPVPELLEEIGWTGGEAISDSRHLVHYMRTTRDGRILFGWGGGWAACGARLGGRSELDPRAVAEVAAHLRSFFPGLEGRRLTHAWGGPIDVSPTHLPIVARAGSDRVHAAFGYTGNGVGPSRMIGRVLASLALDRRDEHSRLALVEPRPHRIPAGLPGWVGGNAIRAGLVSKEAAEEVARDPHAVSRGLAAIPGLIGFHISR